MTPRQYDLGRRQDAADATRERIVAAARAVIVNEKRGVRPFSIEAVADEAGVARTTVYHQFGTRTALLEALFDHLAERGEIAQRLGAAFQRTDARAVMDGVIEAFAFFWESDPAVMRRIQALGVLDVELGEGLTARHRRRRAAITAVVQRVRGATRRTDVTEDVDDEAIIDLAYVLTSFETFTALAGNGGMMTVVPVVQRLVWDAVTGY